MTALLGILLCASPLLCVLLGYYIGRYGSPIVISRQPRRDRRAPRSRVDAAADDEPADHSTDQPATVYMFPER